MIKYTTKKVISLQAWDDLVEKTYGKPYCFQQQDGCKGRELVNFSVPYDWTSDEEMNNSIPDVINGQEMGVKFDVWLARDPEEWNGKKEDKHFVRMFWQRNFYPDFGTIVNDLHAKGLIEAGEYSIDIDW